MSLPTNEEMDNGVRRLTRTSEGMLLYRRLQMILMEVPPLEPSGALLASHGRRTLARELKSLMDSELIKAGLPSDRPGEFDPDRPAIVRPAEPVDLRRIDSRRRVADDDYTRKA